MKHKLKSGNLLDGLPRGRSDKYFKDQQLPQARWIPPDDILAHKPFHYDPKNPDGMILIGAIGGQLIGIEDNRHAMTVAGNRSGKSVTVICNLIFYDGSIFAIDPKGELANATVERRAQLGQFPVVLDPFNRTKGKARKYCGRYNPMCRLSADSGTAIEDGMQIVDGIVITSGKESDPHWNEAAGEFILGCILYQRFAPDIPEAQRTLIGVRRLIKSALSSTEDGQSYLLPRLVSYAAGTLRQQGHDDIADAMEAAIRGLFEKSKDEMSSVLSTVKRHTAFLDLSSMCKVLSGHDIDLADLKRKPNGVSIYLCLPATRMVMCNRWLRILVNQLIDAMEMEETVPKAPVLAVLDEFPVLGHMKQLENAAGQVASFHLKLWTILQDWSQGKSIYKERWESFAANAGWTQWFANSDLATTEYICKRLGKTPIQTTRQGDSSYDQVEKGQAGRSTSLELHDLLRPEEIAKTFAREDAFRRQLIMLAGLNPMIVERVEHWREDAAYHHVFKGNWEA